MHTLATLRHGRRTLAFIAAAYVLAGCSSGGDCGQVASAIPSGTSSSHATSASPSGSAASLAPSASASSHHTASDVPPPQHEALPNVASPGEPPRPVVAWRPDGKALAIAAGPTLLLEPFPSGPPRSLTGHAKDVVALVFSYQGDRLASIDEGGSVRLWDAKTGKASGELPGAAEGVRDLAFSGDGKLFAAAGTSITVWRTEPMKKVCATEPVNAMNLAFSRDQGSVVTSAIGDFARWNAATCAREATGSANTGGTFGLWVSPDGAHAVAAGGDGHEVQLFEARGFSGLQVLVKVDDCRDHVGYVHFSRDGEILLAEGGLRWFHSFRVASQKTIASYDIPHPDEVTDLLMFDDGERLLVVRGSKGELVSGPSRSVAYALDLGSATVFDLSWDMKHLAGASAREVRVWDTATGKLEGTYPIAR